MRMVVCDQCGTKKPIEVVDWIETKTIGSSGQTFADRSIEGEFCSDECVVKYFEARKNCVSAMKARER